MRRRENIRDEKTWLKLIQLYSFYLLIPIAAFSADPAERLVPRMKGYLNSPYGYWEYLPKDYNKSTKAPLVIFLHGIKETGTGTTYEELHKVWRVGVPQAIQRFKRDFDFVMIAPQSPGLDDGFNPERIERLINIVKNNYHIDENRIYVTGLSYGAYAALKLAEYMPNEFAAIVPISSCGDVHNYNKIKDIPLWAFVNAGDQTDIRECMEGLIDNIRSAGGTPLLTQYPYMGHNAWTRTYKNNYVWEWLLKQRRSNPEENQAPLLIDPGDRIVGVGMPAIYTLMASDKNNDSLQFSIDQPLSKGANLSLHKNGHAELMLTAMEPGTYNISILVSDGKGGVSMQKFFLRTSYTLLFLPYLLLVILEPFIVDLPVAFVGRLILFFKSIVYLMFTQIFNWLLIQFLALFSPLKRYS